MATEGSKTPTSSHSSLHLHITGNHGGNNVGGSADGCGIGGGISGAGTIFGGSLGRDRRKERQSILIDTSDEEVDDSQATNVDRIKSDRIPVTKPEEDRRRRTIIVEKRNGTFGFTLQSYGIHYKKEQELEMITYVDYVEYDGPAYKAGMREGDVILSINGTDMEKANHKTLVAFIKNCDTRMRMVVLFEDCVRKVELHMHYIQLQNVLQSKMNELERICLRERELLEGKWKTHSLPARKKATTSPAEGENGLSPNLAEQPTIYRPALSTEDVNAGRTRAHNIIPPPAQFMLTYQYLDPTYRYVLKPSTSSSSGEYFISVGGPTRNPSEQHYILTRAGSTENTRVQYVQRQEIPPQPPQRNYEEIKILPQQTQQTQQKNEQISREDYEQQKPQKSGRHCHGHSCNPCIGHFGRKSTDTNNGDNVSLDAYDLASPCCDPHCVPTRRKTRHHKDHNHKHKHRDKETKERTRPRSQSHVSPNVNHHHHHHHHPAMQSQQPSQQSNHQHHHHQTNNAHPNDCKSNRSRYFDLTAGLASHCSLHSCTSSEFAPADSSASYSTSLSTDTLYWDPQSDKIGGSTGGGNSRQHSTKSRQSCHIGQQSTHGQNQSHVQFQAPGIYQQRYHVHATQIQPPHQIYPHGPTIVNKPKSWDNLATKAVGGYGFGYGYLDTVAPKPPIKLQIAQQRHSIPRKNPYGRYSTYTDVENYAPPPSQFVEHRTTITTTSITTKSTENLLEYGGSNNIATNSQRPEHIRCDCMLKEATSTTTTGVKAPVTVPVNETQHTPVSIPQPHHHHHHQNCRAGYYSNLPRSVSNANPNGQTRNDGVATVSEITRL